VKVAVLSLVTVAITAPVAALAELCLGGGHLVPAAAAAGLCLPPAAVTLLLADLVFRRFPDYGPVAVMVGTAFRMVVAVVGVVGLGGLMSRAGVDPDRFAGWVVFLYLTTLVTESALLVRGAAGVKCEPRPGEGPAG
jgi:hypothetical protein